MLKSGAMPFSSSDINLYFWPGFLHHQAITVVCVTRLHGHN